MGSPAEFNRVGASFEHTHLVSVLVTEEGNSAKGLGLFAAGLEVSALVVGEDLSVGEVLDGGDLFGGHGLKVAEVEAQVVGSHP